jgi:hypothetical protein
MFYFSSFFTFTVGEKLRHIYYVHACAHVKRKSNTFFYFFIGINARAPPEPYYGRLIGSFTEFAHGIKVKL